MQAIRLAGLLRDWLRMGCVFWSKIPQVCFFPNRQESSCIRLNYFELRVTLEFTFILEHSGKMSGATICYTFIIFLIFFCCGLCTAFGNFLLLFFLHRAKVLCGQPPFHLIHSAYPYHIPDKYLFAVHKLFA